MLFRINNSWPRLAGVMLWSVAVVVMMLPAIVKAEPYLAVRTGQKCMACHVNPTGGGKRNEFGNIYARNTLAARKLLKDEEAWYGRLNNYLSFGGDLRTNLDSERVPNQQNRTEFNLDETLLYMEANIIPGRATFYFDQRIAPGSALNREAYALLWTKEQQAYLKAGRFFLASGTRLEDDGALIREISGFNFNNSDTGVEAGLELPNWSTSLSISNGTNGGSETNNGKQIGVRAEYIQPNWRLGVSGNHNDGDNNADRTVASLFTGFRLWGLDWLGELDTIEDKSTSTTIHREVYYLEANLEYLKGHNLKLSFEQLDPDTDVDEDEQTRTSLVWEYVPFEYTQVRAGVRLYDGIPQNDQQNRDEYFLQLHNFF